MKTKIMALILSTGLGITGIAMTAQAAASATASGCKHETLNYFESFISAEYYNGLNHMSTYRTGYKCSNCSRVIIEDKDYRIEQHDYEQIYYHDGKVESVCLGCHDSYYW